MIRPSRPPSSPSSPHQTPNRFSTSRVRFRLAALADVLERIEARIAERALPRAESAGLEGALDPQARPRRQAGHFPSVSEFGRVRGQLRAKITWEIVEDLFLGLTLLESYDSDPQTEGAARTDLSLTTSFGWSF